MTSETQLSLPSPTALLSEDDLTQPYMSEAAREQRLTELRVAILKGPLNYQVLCEEFECPLRVLIQDVNAVVKELAGSLDKVDVGSYRAMILMQKQMLRAQIKEDLDKVDPEKRKGYYDLLNRMLDDELAFIEKSAPPPTRGQNTADVLELAHIQGGSIENLTNVLKVVVEKLVTTRKEPITVDADSVT